MKRIFLIGYMGVGKTTSGRALASKLGLDFIDLDYFIQGRFQKTITELFDSVGEDKFREIEQNALHEISEFENVVISTGGGTPCFFDNMQHMNEKGTTVYLKISTALLVDRLDHCKDKRPLIRDKNKEELYDFVKENLNQREPIYNQAKIIYETRTLVNKEDVDNYIDGLIKLV